MKNMDSQLITTEEMLKGLSCQLRMASYNAIDCSNHLAIHSTRNNAMMLHEVAGKVSELATIVREIGNSHERATNG